MKILKLTKANLLLLSIIVIVDHGSAQFVVENAFPNLIFSRPVDLQSPMDGSNRLFVVEQEGRIHLFDNQKEVASTRIFLDLKDQIIYGNEMGLLGMAFHPDYIDSGYFYVNYTAPAPLRTVISRFTVNAEDPDSANINSEIVLLEIEQPYANHNGGQLAFGPDGYLYIGLGDGGDGGDGGDPDGHGQNRQTLLGAMLRIDVDHLTEDSSYSIPLDNPFVGNQEGIREEIFAYGLRNPWRFSFDRLSGELWAADVGQDGFEEIDILKSGGNYGWNIMEGSGCFNPPNNCDTVGLALPIWEYDDSAGISITGGLVYRGAKFVDLYGKYVYADWGSGTGWALSIADSNNPVNETIFQIGEHSVTAFGADEAGEIYFCSLDGSIYELKDESLTADSFDFPADFRLYPNYPNPFNPVTKLKFDLPHETAVSLMVFDILGNEVTSLIENKLGAGAHEVSWDGRDSAGRPLPGGLYIARLRTPSFAKSLKLVLLK